MRTKGRIKNWNKEKGFGFIEPSLGGNDVFIHISSLVNKNREPKIGYIVTYTLSSDKQGRPYAGSVALPGDKFTPPKKKKGGVSMLVVAISFIVAIGLSVTTNKLPPLFLALYIVASIITFALYAIDKSAAKKGRWRTPEANLHLASLLGGWPGALVAQSMLRHKSKKQPFRFIFWVTVILNCSALLWVLTPEGSKYVHSFISGGA